MQQLMEAFSRITTLPPEMGTIAQPRDSFPGVRTVVITAEPDYAGSPLTFEQCREHLLGIASAIHVSSTLRQRSKSRANALCGFFTDRGLACTPVPPTVVFPVKIMAARCGIGSYGKNSMIQHPDYGSWIALTAFLTNARLPADPPLLNDCGSCSCCVDACPGGALHTPYICDESRCLNFHLGHNKKYIPPEIRDKARNLLGSACTICRDVCPQNRKIAPAPNLAPPPELLNPPLLEILSITDAEWANTFAHTRMGMAMGDKKFLQRNAVIGLGNFQDKRALPALAPLADDEDPVTAEYARWAIAKITGR